MQLALNKRPPVNMCAPVNISAPVNMCAPVNISAPVNMCMPISGRQICERLKQRKIYKFK